MASLLLVLVALIGGGLALLFQGAAIALAVRMPHIYPAVATPGKPLPRVSVVIAARNEESDIGPCLDGLLAQEYPGEIEIVVVDGGSTDRTREIVRSRAPRVRLLEEPALPAGWVGKNWACHLGARATEGEFLLFTDADMRYDPRMVLTAVDWAERDRADLVTFGSRIEMAGFWENVVMPFYTQVVLTYFRAPHVNRPRSSAAVANGQFLLVRRGVYDSLGGHEAIHGAILEDVKLAQRCRAAGRPMRMGWAPELLSTRMYRDRHEMFEGLLKNVHGTEFSAVRQVAFLAALVGFFLLPLAILPVGLTVGSPLLVVFGALLFLALFAKHAIFTKAVGGKAVYGLLYPLAVGFYLVLVATSLSRALRHAPLVWKGRAYPRET